MVKHGLPWVILTLWLNQSWAATFEARVDRHQLSIEEKLTLTLQLFNSDTRLRAEGVNPNIDLSILGQHFDIGIPRADFRYNIYQGRGRSTSELQVELFPKRAGETVIPAFTVDNVSTDPIDITIKALPPDTVPEVFVRSGAGADTLWAGQQLVVYLDIFHRVEFAEANLSDILETEPTRIELMPHWQLPQDSYTADHKGFRYTVERLAWALFPDQSGTLTVHLPSTVITTTTGRQQRLAHQSQTITVRALPEGLPNNIIIGKPQVSRTPLPTTLRQHQLTSWTVSVEAPVAVISLPDRLPLADIPQGIRVYTDRARRDTVKTASGIVDKAEYTLSVMGLVPGDYTLPPMRIPYFDPDQGHPDRTGAHGVYRHARLTARGACGPPPGPTRPSCRNPPPLAHRHRRVRPAVAGHFGVMGPASAHSTWRSQRRPSCIVRPTAANRPSPPATTAAHRPRHPHPGSRPAQMDDALPRTALRRRRHSPRPTPLLRPTPRR